MAATRAGTTKSVSLPATRLAQSRSLFQSLQASVPIITMPAMLATDSSPRDSPSDTSWLSSLLATELGRLPPTRPTIISVAEIPQRRPSNLIPITPLFSAVA